MNGEQSAENAQVCDGCRVASQVLRASVFDAERGRYCEHPTGHLCSLAASVSDRSEEVER